jgi:hypothetical protein
MEDAHAFRFVDLTNSAGNSPAFRPEMKGGKFIRTLLEVYQHFIVVWPYYIIDAVVFSNCAYHSADRPFQVHLQSIEGWTNGSGEDVEQVPGRAAVGDERAHQVARPGYASEADQRQI